MFLSVLHESFWFWLKISRAQGSVIISLTKESTWVRPSLSTVMLSGRQTQRWCGPKTTTPWWRAQVGHAQLHTWVLTHYMSYKMCQRKPVDCLLSGVFLKENLWIACFQVCFWTSRTWQFSVWRRKIVVCTPALPVTAVVATPHRPIWLLKVSNCLNCYHRWHLLFEPCMDGVKINQ